MSQKSYLPQEPAKHEMRDVKFMSAKEKEKVLKQWELFIKSGCLKSKFSQALYHHLMQHCSFIAHYDLHGFYATYFEQGDDTVHFLSQFDTRNGIPRSIEYGMTYWYTDADYGDINAEMCRIASRYVPALIGLVRVHQKNADIARADRLLAKHGIVR